MYKGRMEEPLNKKNRHKKRTIHILHKVILRRVLRQVATNRCGSSIKHLALRTRKRHYLEFVLHVLVHFHDGRHVAATIAVIGSRPHCHELIVKHVLVSLHHELMRATNEIQVVRLVEFAHAVAAEYKSTSARVGSPSHEFFFGIGPQHVAHASLVRKFNDAIDGADFVEGVNRGRQPAVDAEVAALHESGQAHAVEHLRAHAPHVDRPVFAQTLVVESVHLTNLS